MDCLDALCLSRKQYTKVKDDPCKNRPITTKQMDYITGLLNRTQYKLKNGVVLGDINIHHASLIIKVLTGEKHISPVTAQYLVRK